MSLLDKASLIQIPSGYKEGKLYSVEPTPTYGSEEVTNGDFATNSDWSLGAGWNISGGTLNGSGTARTYQGGVSTGGKLYKITYDIVVYTSGSVRMDLGSAIGSVFSGVGSYSEIILASGNTNLYINQTGRPFVGSIDNVSVKEVTNIGDFDFSRSSSATRVNSDGLIETASVIGTTEEVTNGDFSSGTGWNQNANWSISGGVAIADGTSSNDINQGTLSAVIGKKYLISFDVVSLSQGTFLAKIGGVGVVGNAVGSFSATVTATSTDRLRIVAQSNAIGTIDNVSVIQYIENDVPRIDYTGGGCGKLLLEPQRTNLVAYSESFDDSYWDKLNASVTANNTTAPNGTMTADLITSTATSETGVYDIISVTNTNTWSIYAKKGTGRYLLINTNVPTIAAKFDLEDGVIVGTPSIGASASIEDYGNGWFRCSISSSTSQNRFTVFITDNTTTADFSSSVGLNCYIWGAQLEQGSYPTSYIPTSGATATRVGDACNGAGTSATFNDSEGVLFAEISALTEDSGTSRRITVSDGTINNRISIELDETEGLIKLFFSGNGTLNQLSTTIDVSQNFKILASYNSQSLKLYINGFKKSEDTTVVLPIGLNDLSFHSGTGSANFYGKTKQLIYFDEALTDLEIESLTSWASFAEMANALNYTVI